MSSRTIITVQSLGKRYILGPREPYYALRDSVMELLRSRRRRAGNGAQSVLWALKDVSFEVQEGEALGVIGRNGAGKSTLLKVLSRITPPTSGRAVLSGRTSSLLEVGTGFHPELTGRENIYLNGAIMGMSRAEVLRKFDDIVEFAEIERLLDTPVKHYSSGMYVRLAFAVAAHLEPEILIIDEVLAVGDAQFQQKCLGRMEEVGRQGRTILFVSHNLAAIRDLCTRTIVLDEGRLVFEGPTSVAISSYSGNVTRGTLAREWQTHEEALRDAFASLKRVRLTDDDGRLLAQVTTDIPFNVEILYRVEVPGTQVGLTLIAYDSEHRCVFSSINNRESRWYGKHMPAGPYLSTCRIPANFFNDGEYSISINLFGKNFTDVRTVSDVLRFQILDGSRVRGDYFGKYAGVVRPLFEWRTEPLTQHPDFGG